MWDNSLTFYTATRLQQGGVDARMGCDVRQPSSKIEVYVESQLVKGHIYKCLVSPVLHMKSLL